jgi:hypothetical protein
MPVRLALLLAALLTVATAAPAAAAPPRNVTPDQLPGYAEKQGTGYVVRADYDPFGLWFSERGANTTIWTIDSNVPSWTGVSVGGANALLFPVQAKIVLPGTGGIPASVSRLVVEAGTDEQAGVRLEGYDCDGNSVGVVGRSSQNDGPHGRSQFTLQAPRIASFRVFTPGNNDHFGVNQINLAQTTACVTAEVALSGDTSGAHGHVLDRRRPERRPRQDRRDG